MENSNATQFAVVTGMKNKVQDTLAKLAPETTSAQLHRKQSEPGSASK